MIKWYIWASIGGGVLLLFLLCVCIRCCCFRSRKKEPKAHDGSKHSSKKSSRSYNRVPIEEGSEEEEEQSKDSTRKFKSDSLETLTLYVAPPPRHKALESVARYNESGAESSFSDIDGSESASVSAYGDQMSTYSTDSRNSYLPREAINSASIAIQTSLIYSRDSKYVAGKIVMVDGLSFETMERKLEQIKCHVVVLPLRKYALKTNWYPIKKARVKMDEYFKFKFKKLPIEGKTMLRFRVYARRSQVGKSHCLGECYVNILEIVTSRGGLTVWRPITKGAPESIVEEDGLD